MGIAKTKVWSHLSTDETTALTLVLGNGKSTWEGGTIMQKSHYKFLEILQRGKHFIKLFSQQYHLYKTLIPDSVTINPIVKDYLLLVIGKRVKPTDAIKQMNHPIFSVTKHRTEYLKRELDKWSVSKEPAEQLFYNLVMEFDRWNNWRILPKELQEPHAFKRRNKNVIRYYLKNWANADIDDSQELVEMIRREKAKNIGYVGIIYNCRSYEFEIVKVNLESKKTNKLCNDLKYFIFKDPKDCEKLLEVVTEYFGKDERKSAEGLNFWPQIRILISRAYNYNQIMGITPDRTITLHNPFKQEVSDQKILQKKGIEL